jgi:nucleoside triphosphatase
VLQEYPEPTVGALIIDAQGKILLVKSHKWKGYLSVPGGHVEFGETLEEAIVREVREETGLRVSPIRLLLVQEAIYAPEFYLPRHFIFFDYLCKVTGGDLSLNEKELQDYLWTTAEEALRLPLEPYTRNMIEAFLRSGSR